MRDSARDRVALALALALLLAAPQLAEAKRGRGPQRLPIEELEALAAGTVDRKGRGLVTLGAGPPPGMNWVELGPRPIGNEYWSGNSSGAGRVNSIAVDPRNGQVAYLAAAQGGVWKTTNGGAVWLPMTEALSSLASGAVTLDPADPDVVYYATGEQNYSIDSFYGDGIFRSEDQGLNWSKVATKTQVGSYIARIVVAPDDSDILYVASNNGVVCSYDHGASWQLMLNVGGADCNDLVVDVTNPGIVYAAIYGRGVYKSVDHGGTWDLLTGGLPTAGFQRINLAIAPSNPLVLYVSFVDGVTYGLLGMYRTADGGANWTLLPATPNYLGSQGWYDNCVVVDPANPNRCLAGGVFPYGAGVFGIIRTIDGGLSWTDQTTAGGTRVHPDQHFMTYGPDGVLWVANDGGVWKSANHGTSWTNCNASLGITQFYTVAKSPTDPNGIVGGTQDNGTVRYSGLLTWPQVVAGDGGPATYLANDPGVFFSTYVYMDPLYKWTAGGASLGDVTGPWRASEDRADWCTGPLVSDPNTPNTILVGTYRVWRSTNGGGSWAVISGDLTTGSGVLRAIATPAGSPGTVWVSTSDGHVHVTTDGGTNWFARNLGLPFARLPKLVVDPAHPQTAWVIADLAAGDRVFKTVDAGVSWNPVTGALPVGLRPFALAVDFRTPVPRLNLGTDFGAYVSTDDGATWIKANANLPDIAVYDLALDPAANALIAGTHGRGIWRAQPDVVGPATVVTAPNGGESWEANLPHTITWTATDPAGVDSVTILLSTNNGASYDWTIASGVPHTGSFVWTAPDTVLPACRIRVIAYDAWRNAAFDASNAPFAIVKSVAVGNPRAREGFDLLPPFPNPGRAPIAFRFVLPRSARVGLGIYDLAGRRVRQLEDRTAEAGAHDVAWDGRDDAGRTVAAGVYFARMSSDAFEKSSRFALLR